MTEEELRTLEKERKNYCDAVLDCSLEDVEKILPTTASSNFFPIMNGIVKDLHKQIKELQSVIEQSISEKDKLEWNIDLKCARAKLDLCEKKLQNYTNPKEVIIETDDYHLIFGKNIADNISFLKDIDSKWEERQKDILIKLLQELKAGYITNNQEKDKQLLHNDKLKGIFEKKGFQMRVYYRKLSDKLFYILMVRLKKDDNPLSLRTEIEQRDKNLRFHYQKVYEQLNTEKIIDIIEENDIIYEQVINLLGGEKETKKANE